MWRDRFRIEVTSLLRSDPDRGNDVLIRNLSSNRILIARWEVCYGPERSTDKDLEVILDSTMGEVESGSSDINIDAYSSYTMNFEGDDHFNFDVRTLRGRCIYLRLWIAGRTPILKMIYPLHM